MSSVVIRGHQRSSEDLDEIVPDERGHQRPSEAIRGHQRPSEVISVISGHQRSSVYVGTSTMRAESCCGLMRSPGAKWMSLKRNRLVNDSP